MELLYDVFYNRLRENFIKMNENSCNSRNSSSRSSSSNNSKNCYNNYLLQYENYNNSFNIYLNNEYGNEVIDIVSVDRDHHHHHDSNNNNKVVVNKNNNNNNEPMDDSDDNNSSDEKVQISLWQPWKLSNSHITTTTKDTKLTSKELPTTKWRRDRRQRTSPEYHHQSTQLQQPPQPTTPTSLPFANCLRLSNSVNDVDLAPLDMSLTMKPRSPPPPYRAPLPGSIYASCVSNSINRNNITDSGSNTNLNHSSSSSSSDSVSPRPSVITQAPKRDAKGIKCEKESISMCDPVIDEHFRRSLGDNYMILFSQNGQSHKKQKPNELNDARPSIDNPKIKTELSFDEDNDDDDDDDIASEEDDADDRIDDADYEIDVQNGEHNNDEDIGVMMDTHSNASSSPTSLSNGNANNAALVRTATLSPKIINNNNNNSSNNSINSNSSNKQQSTTTTTTISSDSIELSVDDHFAKALGETWKKLQENNSSTKKDTLRPCVN